MTERPSPAQVTLILGTAAGGMGTHVRMLAAGLAARGTRVTVAGPPAAAARSSISALPLVSFSPVEISSRPRASDLAAIVRLRGLLDPPGRTVSQADSPAGDHVAHAHGLRAGALTVLTLLLIRPRRRPGLVVTVHNAPPGGAAGLVYRLLEQVAARGADLVLCVSPDLEHRMRAAGARHVERAVIAAPRPPSGSVAVSPSLSPADAALPCAPDSVSPPVAPDRAAPASAGGPAVPVDPVVAPDGHPMVLAAGRLAAQKDFGVLLGAAVAWRDLDPPPLLVIAGDGPLAGELRARAAALGVAASFPGHRGDVPALLAAAAVFVLPSRWEGQPLVLQEALRAGTPVVATRVGGVPGLAGDAALLVPPGDARALAGAVRSVLTDPPLAARLRAAAAARGAALPTEADAVTAALDAYSSVPRGARLR